MEMDENWTIAIDFDGVIHSYVSGWTGDVPEDPPMPGAFEAIEKLLDKGYSIFIHSTRSPHYIRSWLMFHEAPFWSEEIPGDQKFWGMKQMVGITDRKLPAVCYIDDRAIRHIEWSETLTQIQINEDVKWSVRRHG